MTSLERKLKATLQRLALSPASKVLIGVSGGADSMALLDAMMRLRLLESWQGEVYSAHVNHLLRGAESDADEKWVEEWGKEWTQTHKLKLPTVATTVDVAAKARETGQNLEATARQVRYDFFRWFAQGYEVPMVFTAHTHDDQTETLVMRWIRGTGATGLRGIHERSALCDGVELIRPLLDVTRAEVLEHCAHYGVPYRTDSSNLSDDYTRNRVRHQLLPLLREFNPQFDAALQRGAAFWQADDECLGAQAEALYLRSVADEQLLITELTDVHQALRGRVLRTWIGGRLQLTAAHAQALERFVMAGQSGRTIQLPNGWRVTREFDRLRLWRAEADQHFPPAAVSLMASQPLSFGAYEFTLHTHSTEAGLASWRSENVRFIALLESVAAAGLWLRTRQAGDAYVPVGRTSPVKLKTLMIRQRIPLAERAAHPLLVTAAGEIVWSPGLPIAASCINSINSPNEHLVWVTARERCNLSRLMGVLSDGVESGS
jgi:tRNA(Ile)-lysidine synthase